jgi:hypothetical protein
LSIGSLYNNIISPHKFDYATKQFTIFWHY